MVVRDVKLVYLIDAWIWTKIGVTSNPGKRMKAMQVDNPHPLKLVGSIASDSPFELERYLHDNLSEYNIGGEWFELPVDIHEDLVDTEYVGFLEYKDDPIIMTNKHNLHRSKEFEEHGFTGEEWYRVIRLRKLSRWFTDRGPISPSVRTYITHPEDGYVKW